MTNQEAIRILEFMKSEMLLSFDNDRKKALNMAIEALKEQPEYSQNTSSKQPDLETLGVKTGETCEDVISREDAIDAIKTSRYLVDAMEKIIRLPSAEPEVIHCKDCKYMRRDVIFDQCWCNRSSRVSPIDDDEYCSRADRRKE